MVAGGPVARGDRAAHSGAGPRDRAAEAREGGNRAGARSAARRAGPARARAGPVARRAGDRPARCQAAGGAVLQRRADADPATARSQTRPSLRAAGVAARARAHRRGRGGAAARGVSHLWRRGGHRASRRAVPGRPAAGPAAGHGVPHPRWPLPALWAARPRSGPAADLDRHRRGRLPGRAAGAGVGGVAAHGARRAVREGRHDPAHRLRADDLRRRRGPRRLGAVPQAPARHAPDRSRLDRTRPGSCTRRTGRGKLSLPG